MEARRQVNEMLEPAANLSAGETPKGTLITKEWADEFEKRLAIEDAARKRLERWLREPAR